MELYPLLHIKYSPNHHFGKSKKQMEQFQLANVYGKWWIQALRGFLRLLTGLGSLAFAIFMITFVGFQHTIISIVILALILLGCERLRAAFWFYREVRMIQDTPLIALYQRGLVLVPMPDQLEFIQSQLVPFPRFRETLESRDSISNKTILTLPWDRLHGVSVTRNGLVNQLEIAAIFELTDESQPDSAELFDAEVTVTFFDWQLSRSVHEISRSITQYIETPESRSELPI